MSNSYKKITIIVPNYNNGKFLSECLDSIFAQKHQNIEIIVIDDGSTDDSIEILEKYNDIILIKQSNLGAAIARNRGLEAATGDYVVFLDSDDILTQGALAILVDAIEKENADMAIGSFVEIGESGEEEGRHYDFQENTSIEKNKIYSEAAYLLPLPANKMYRMEAIKKYKVSWANVRIGQDLGFYLKYLAHCRKIALVKECIAKYRICRHSITRSYDLRIFDIVNSLSDVREYYEEYGKIDIYDKYLPLLVLRHYYKQSSKQRFFKDKKMRKLILEFFAIHERQIDCSKTETTSELKKIRRKFRIKYYLRSFFASEIYRHLKGGL